MALTSKFLELRKCELKLNWEKSPIKRLISQFWCGRKSQISFLREWHLQHFWLLKTFKTFHKMSVPVSRFYIEVPFLPVECIQNLLLSPFPLSLMALGSHAEEWGFISSQSLHAILWTALQSRSTGLVAFTSCLFWMTSSCFLQLFQQDNHPQQRPELKQLLEPVPLWAAVGTAAKSLQSCPTLCDPIDGSPPGSAVPGILQARTPEWVAISFSINGPREFLLPILSPPKELVFPLDVTSLQ